MSVPLCTLPWTGLDISPQGGIKPCCKYKQTIATDIDDYYSSPILAQLRDDLLTGKRPDGCRRCWDDESAGLPSKRQLDHQYVLSPDESLKSLKILSMTFGNTCNLSCVTCNSFASSRWAIEERKIKNLNLSSPIRPIIGHNKFYQKTNLLTRLTELSGNLKLLEIHGGEPFYASPKIHKDFLKSLANPKDIKIHYMTNATIFPDQEFWEIWKNFRHVDIQFSIDATEKKFEYLRYPARWHDVLENIHKYQKQDDIQISISHTVSWLNIADLDDFFRWCRRQGLPNPYIGTVSNPAYLSPRCLPHSVKLQIRQKLSYSPVIQPALNFMDQEDWSSFFPQALDWITVLDKTRKTNFASVFPELDEFIQNP